LNKKMRMYCRRRKIWKEVEDLSEWYDYGYFHGDAYDNYTFENVRRKFLGKISFVKKFHKGEGRLLDVGCALGFSVKIAQDEGFDAFGVDLSKYAVSEARKLVGDRVLCADVETEIPFASRYFDVVTAWDVLEHLKRPDLFLRSVNRVLKEKGLLFISTVNYSSLLSRIMREHWVFIGSDHLSYTITPTKLRSWLENAGLSELSITTNNIALGMFPLPNSETVRKTAKITEQVLTFLLWPVLRSLDLGDIIVCVARKRLEL